MPTRARTSVANIVSEGRRILEAEGLDGLTMQAVASAVGIRAPSLYKRVRDRGDLVHLIANDIARDIGDKVEAAVESGDPKRDLRAIADAYRSYAHEHPVAFALATSRLPERWRADPEVNARAAEAVLRISRALSGEEHALEAARTVVAWANGFIGMELAGAFRLGGDVERAWAFGIEHLATALEPASVEGR